MKKGNFFRIYPTKIDSKRIDRTIEMCRCVWNWYLGMRYLGISAHNARQIEDRDQLAKFVGKEIKSLPKKIYSSIKDLELEEQVEKVREDRSERVQLACLVWDVRGEKDVAASVKVVVDDFLKEKDLPLELSDKNIQGMTTKLKDEKPWLKDAPSQALNEQQRTAKETFSKSFKVKFGYPKFKHREKANSFSNQNNLQKFRKDGTPSPKQNRVVRTSEHMGFLTIPKFKNIKIRLHREIEGEIGTVTISRSPTGKYYASFPTEVDHEPQFSTVTEENSVGIDLGLKSFIHTSDGEVFAPFFRSDEYQKLEERKAVLQRRLQKKRDKNSKWKRSKRYLKAKIKLARVEEKLAFLRKDHHQKLSHRLTTGKYALIGIEDLGVSGMIKNKKLARTIARAGWRSFRTMLEYKGKLHGVEVVPVGRTFPSSKMCSSCGHKKTDLTLSDREWVCEKCGAEHDRDHNAAINIRNEAFRIHQSRTWGLVSDSK